MKNLKLAIIGFLFCISGILHADAPPDTKPLRVGMLPSLSLQRLFERFKPIQAYLEKTLQRPVILLTATDYATYIKRAGQYEYDLYFAAPHMAALVEKDYGYRRVSKMTRDLVGDIIVRDDGGIKRVEDLKERTISAPQELAIITMMGESLLEQHHLFPGRNVRIDYTGTHNNALLALTTGKVDAAIAVAPIYEVFRRDHDTKLTVLATTPTASHLMFMASPKLPEQEYEKLRAAMLAFRADGAGKEFFLRNPYGDSAPISNADMQEMQPYAAILRQRISTKKE